MSLPLGIYIHVPFCASKCPYCDFYSRPGTDERMMDEYCGALLRHFSEWERMLGGYRADTIYFGGGTPTVLGEKRLIRLLNGIKKGCAVAENAEITFEANPESCDAKQLKKLCRAGFNRISFGVQSADDGMLRTLGRIHTFQQAADAVAAAKSAGFYNISIDMMYGLPGETDESALATAEALSALGPTHLSAYALKLSDETPMGQAAPVLPEDDAVADRYLALVDFFTRSGFSQYEISNFARPGMESRHNRKYWTLAPYLGLGPSAHSYFGGKRFSFVSDLNAYIDGVRQGSRLIAHAEDTEEGDRCGEYLMLSLRTTEGIREAEITGRFRRDFAPFAEILNQCAAHGLAEKTEGGYRLTPSGFFISNTIISELLLALDRAPVMAPRGYRRPPREEKK